MRSDEAVPLVSYIAIFALGILVVGSALAVGTVHFEVLLWVSGFALLSTSFVLFVGRSEVRRLPGPALILLALSAWSALQAVPMPLGVLAKIAPHNADVWLRALRPFGEPALSRGSISLDPGASLVEALKWFTYAMVITLAHLASSWRSRVLGPAVAFASAAVVSLVALGHGLAGATSLFGIYTPELAVPRWGVPPILNPNNLSGYLNLGTFCGLGLLLAQRRDDEPRPVLRRGLIGAGLAVVVAVSVLAASRAGALGLGLGVLLFAALVWISGSDRRERAKIRGEKLHAGKVLVPAVIAFGGGILLAVVGANDATWKELWDSNAEKLRIATWSMPLIKDFPVFGVGRGAFESVFPVYRPASGHVLYAYPENFVIQWIAEWGVPAAAAAILSLIWMYRPARGEGPSDTVRIGAWVGIGVLLLQNLVDLALEVPGIAILACAVLGSLFRDAPRDLIRSPDEGGERRRRRRTFLSRRRMLGPAVFGAGALALGLAVTFGNHSVEEERSTLYALSQRLRVDDAGSLTAFRDRLRDAIKRHPGEPYFPLLGAIATNRFKGGNAMPWIAAALERDAANGRAHLVLSDVLAAKGAKMQALMELRLAVEDEPALNWAVGQGAARLSRDAETLERVAPDGAKGASVLLGIASALAGSDKHDVRMTLLDHAIARDPTSAGALFARANEVLSAVADSLTPCANPSQRTACLALVRGDADAIRRASPVSCDSVILQARASELEDKVDAGEDLLAAGCGACHDTGSCAVERVRLAAKRKPATTLLEAVRTYLAVACSLETPCMRPQVYMGDFFAQRAEWTLAASHYRLAAVASDKAEMWLKAADAASRAGDLARASQDLAKAQRRGAGDKNLELRVQQQRGEMMRHELDQVDHRN